jgi:outer membrane protein
LLWIEGYIYHVFDKIYLRINSMVGGTGSIKNLKRSNWFWRTVLLLAIFSGWSVIGTAAELKVKLENPPTAGAVSFQLYDSANTFGDLRDPYRIERFPLDGRDVYHLENIPPGEYVLLVHHDENNNDQIDKNFIGIPKEPLGFSNNYQPKGPPRYVNAAFVLQEGEPRRFVVELYRPLGKLGRLGVGLGVIARSSPYRGYNGGVYQFIPAVTYIGSRLQIFGPAVRFGLIGSGKLRLAATGNYRIGAYKEDDSDYLKGMGDRKSTFMLGLSVQSELPGDVGLSAGYSIDVLGEIDDGEAQLSLNKSFQYGVVSLSPNIALNWLSTELSNYDYGVTDSQATPGRPGYGLGDTISVEGGLGVSVEVTPDWLFAVSASVEWLGDDVVNSPIVSEDYVVKGFSAINYIF